MLQPRNLVSAHDKTNKPTLNGDNNFSLTWRAAYRIADQQIVFWQRSGITASEATKALEYDFPATWDAVRWKLAAWVMQHGDEPWED